MSDRGRRLRALALAGHDPTPEAESQDFPWRRSAAALGGRAPGAARSSLQNHCRLFRHFRGGSSARIRGLNQMLTAGIVIDDWKLPVFERRLKAANTEARKQKRS